MAPSPGVCQLFCCLSALLDFLLKPRDCHAGAVSEHAGVWPSLGRRDRRFLTQYLNQSCGNPQTELMPAEFGLGLWSPARVVLKRRCRRLFKHQRLSWHAFPRCRAEWSGWPSRGCRIGEAGHPGPRSDTDGRERSPPPGPSSERARVAPRVGARLAGKVFCPVPGCLCGDPARARGWANEASMRSHIDSHLAGSLPGDVPNTWLEERQRIRCPVCGLSVSERFGVHPTCRPEARGAAVDDTNPMEIDGLPLPTFQEIQSARTPTLRHVPAAARHMWNQLLTRALAAVVHSNDERAWRELLMLAQCVLCAPLRGGRRHKRAAAAFTLDRMQRWQEGERMALWDSRPVHARRRANSPTPEERRELATALGREGFDKKACAALLSQGLCPHDAETASALQTLHPASSPPSDRPLQSLPLAPDIAPELVARSLRAFPAETAPGPTGLRVQHLRDACTAGSRESFLTQLAAVVQLLAQGRAPSFVAPVLAGAGLVALPKPSGGVRPIAVGEIFRRLTGKCLMALVQQEARTHFWPAQVGVAVKGGAEKAVHAVRAWAQRHAGSATKALVKLDFTNAFNCISREAVLQQACTDFPALARWSVWCYRQPTRLQFGERALDSSSGVQQGDPLGPLLFSAALQPLAADLRSSSLDIAVHFLDDGVLAGELADVASALARVQRRAAAIGLTLNLGTCEVVVLGPVPSAALAASFPAELLQRSDGSSRVLHDFEFLGAAVGSDSYVHNHTEARVARAAELLDAIAELEDPQVAMRLLRACAGYARVVHSMRCNPPLYQHMALQAFDTMVRSCFAGFTGIHPTAEQWRQAELGLAQAGLGLRSAAVHAPAAYLASLGTSLPACAELDRSFTAGPVVGGPEVTAALLALNARLPGNRAMAREAALDSKQRELSMRVDSAGWDSVLLAANPTARATLFSEAGAGARAFLSALPAGRTRMEPAIFIAELRVRLRVPEAAADAWCPRCDGVLDCHGHHAGMCVAGGERTQRHNAVRDLVFAWTERAGLRPEKERTGLLLPQCPDDTQSARRRPADVYLPALSGSPAALDFAITAPQRQGTLAMAGRATGAAAEAYARHKESHLDTARSCEHQGVSFVPMVAETTGTWDKSAMTVLKNVAKAVAARTGEDPASTQAAILQELSVTIRSWRARAALRRRHEAAD